MMKATDLGTLKVHDEVIIALVEEAVLATPGVAHMISRGVRDELNQWLKKDGYGRGVTVTAEPPGFSIDLFIAVYYGERLPELGRRIVDRVYQAVKAAIEVGPSNITVHIEGLETLE
ncbi:MAG: Asp23/Gls24 family envelope stress response protein [Firmicutes bacterium]|jgi:uncharacterized alkaline shock family protein YloU|nr:Asp23/Gls24 family envelope stress response protein [Bacillota bacterium]MCL5066329.1 Asp23/Gls24 family envelope stress response protein [Bacillota bacterium]